MNILDITNWAIGILFCIGLIIQLFHDKLSLPTMYIFLIGNALSIIVGSIQNIMYVIIPSSIQLVLLIVLVIRITKNNYDIVQ